MRHTENVRSNALAARVANTTTGSSIQIATTTAHTA